MSCETFRQSYFGTNIMQTLCRTKSLLKMECTERVLIPISSAIGWSCMTNVTHGWWAHHFDLFNLEPTKFTPPILNHFLKHLYFKFMWFPWHCQKSYKCFLIRHYKTWCNTALPSFCRKSKSDWHRVYSRGNYQWLTVYVSRKTSRTSTRSHLLCFMFSVEKLDLGYFSTTLIERVNKFTIDIYNWNFCAL